MTRQRCRITTESIHQAFVGLTAQRWLVETIPPQTLSLRTAEGVANTLLEEESPGQRQTEARNAAHEAKRVELDGGKALVSRCTKVRTGGNSNA